MTSMNSEMQQHSLNFEIPHFEFQLGGEMNVSKRIFDTKKRVADLIEKGEIGRYELNEVIRSLSIRIKDLNLRLMPTVLFEFESSNVDITKIVRGGGIGKISKSDMKVAMLTSGKPSANLIEKFNKSFPTKGKYKTVNSPPIPINYAMNDNFSESNEVEIIVFPNSYNTYGDASNFRLHRKFYDVLKHTAVFWTKNEDNDAPKEDPKLQAYYALKNDLRRHAPELINRFLMVPLHSFPSYAAYKRDNHTQSSVSSYKEQLSSTLRAFMRDNAGVKTIHLWIQGSVKMNGKRNFIFKMNNPDLCEFFLNEAKDYALNGIHSLQNTTFGSFVKHLDQVDGVVDGDDKFPYYLFEAMHAFSIYHDDVVKEGYNFLTSNYHDKMRQLKDAWYNHTVCNFTSLMLIGFPIPFVKLLLEAMDIDSKESADIMRAKMHINGKLSSSYDADFSKNVIDEFIKTRPTFDLNEEDINVILRSLNDLKHSFFQINVNVVMSKILIKLYEFENADNSESDSHMKSLLFKRFSLDNDNKGFFHEVGNKCILFNLPASVAQTIYEAGIPITGVVIIDADTHKYNLSTRFLNTLQPTNVKQISKNMAELLTFAINNGINVFSTLFDALQPGLVLAVSGVGKSTFVSSINNFRRVGLDTGLSVHRRVLKLHNTYSRIPSMIHHERLGNYGDRMDNVILLGLNTSCLYRMTHLSSDDSLLTLPSIGSKSNVDGKVPDCIIPNTTIIHNFMEVNNKRLASAFNEILVNNFRMAGIAMSNLHYEYLHVCPNVKLRCVNIGDLITSEKVDTFYGFNRLYGWKMYPVVRINTLSNGMTDEAIQGDIQATIDIINEFVGDAHDDKLMPSLFIASWKVDVKGFAGLTAMAYRSVFKFGRSERDLITLRSLNCLNASGHALSAFLTPKSILLHYLEEILFSDVSSPFSFPTNEPVTGRNFHSKEDYIAAIKFALFATSNIKDVVRPRVQHTDEFMPYVNEMLHRILMFEVVIKYLDR